MSVTNKTGNQASFTWDVGTANLVFTVFAISEWGWERMAIEDDNLLSEMFMPTIPGSLWRIDPMTLSVRYDASVATLPSYHAPETGPGSAVKLARLDFPGGLYKLEGSAFLLRFNMPSMVNNERMNASLTVQWDPRETAWYQTA